jgi:hypothetical protein
MTVTLGWEWIAGLALWSAVLFRLGMAFAGGEGRGRGDAGGRGRGDLSGREPPKGAGRTTPPAAARAVGPGPAGLDPQAHARIAEALRDGRKIEAIKIMREATGLGLAEAKTAVEAMDR